MKIRLEKKVELTFFSLSTKRYWKQSWIRYCLLIRLSDLGQVYLVWETGYATRD